MSAWTEHVERWKDGCGSELCPLANKVCLARGQVPCDVLFCGESPGDSENVIGRPFVGPAGKLLDQIISKAMGDSGLRVAITNLVGCFPKLAKQTGDHEPPPEAIECCAPRLEDFVALCKPRLIVCVGALAESWIMGVKKSGKRHILKGYDGKLASIAHPASILRANVAMRGLAVQKAVVTLANAVEELEEVPSSMQP